MQPGCSRGVAVARGGGRAKRGAGGKGGAAPRAAPSPRRSSLLQAEAERRRGEVAFELREATAGEDEHVLERCIAAAQRNGVAKAEVASARAALKKIAAAREAPPPLQLACALGRRGPTRALA